jgi:transposase-like protein
MEEKLRFVYEYERDEEAMKELCSRYKISRETGYVWLRRYRKHGAGCPRSLAFGNRGKDLIEQLPRPG